jgi:hypothetical protein
MAAIASRPVLSTPSRVAQSALAVIAATIIAASLAGAAGADDHGVTATLAPTEIALTPGGSARVTVVTSAGSAFAGSVVYVRPRSSEASVAVAPDRASETMQADGSAVLDFTVTRKTEGSGQDPPCDVRRHVDVEAA